MYRIVMAGVGVGGWSSTKLGPGVGRDVCWHSTQHRSKPYALLRILGPAICTVCMALDMIIKEKFYCLVVVTYCNKDLKKPAYCCGDVHY